eukprot:SAG11_NODE_1868_length_4151_cov_8.778134_5_plen_190_part_00
MTHKDVDTFIRANNRAFQIKRYSRLRLADKVALVEREIERNSSTTFQMEAEWVQLKKRKGIARPEWDRKRAALKEASSKRVAEKRKKTEQERKEKEKREKEKRDSAEPKVMVFYERRVGEMEGRRKSEAHCQLPKEAGGEKESTETESFGDEEERREVESVGHGEERERMTRTIGVPTCYKLKLETALL